MKDGISGKVIYRKDYTAYPWDVNHLDLHFDVGIETTIVRAEMEFRLPTKDKPERTGITADRVLEEPASISRHFLEHPAHNNLRITPLCCARPQMNTFSICLDHGIAFTPSLSDSTKFTCGIRTSPPRNNFTLSDRSGVLA
jgi:hypothetical protein